MRSTHFDENCIYLTRNDAVTKHAVAVSFLTALFEKQSLDSSVLLERVFQKVELNPSGEDFLLYVALQEDNTTSALATNSQSLPCLVLLDKGQSLAPQPHCYVFFALSNIEKIGGYLAQHGFFGLGADGYFKDSACKENHAMDRGADPAEIIEDIAEHAPPIVPDRKIATENSRKTAILHTLNSGFLCMEKTIYHYPKRTRVKIHNIQPRALALMSAEEWKKAGYTIKQDSKYLLLPESKTPPLPLYDQTQIEAETPPPALYSDTVLRNGIITAQNRLREDTILRDRWTREHAYIEPTSLRDRTRPALLQTFTALIPFVAHGETDKLNLPETLHSLVDRAAQNIFLLHQGQDAQGLQAQNANIAEALIASSVEPDVFFEALNRHVLPSLILLQEEAGKEQAREQIIDRAKHILETVNDDAGKDAVLQVATYTGENKEVHIGIDDAEKIIVAFEHWQSQQLENSMTL